MWTAYWFHTTLYTWLVIENRRPYTRIFGRCGKGGLCWGRWCLRLATLQEWGIMYKEVVQSVLLYGSYRWVFMGSILKVIEVFHHMVSRRIKGMTERRTMSGEGGWPPMAEALDTAGIWPIKEYIQRKKYNVVVQAACRTIYKLYTGSEIIPQSPNDRFPTFPSTQSPTTYIY